MNLRLFGGVGMLLLVGPHLLPAAPPLDRLLPTTTREFVALPDVGRLEANWDRTNFGKLFADPLMKPFREALGPTSWLPGPVPSRLKLTPGEVRDLAGGGVGWAFVQPTPTQAAHVVWLDTRGKVEARNRWAEACAARLRKAGGKVNPMTLGGTEGTHYETARGEMVYSVVREDLLLFCDDRTVLEGVLSRWNGKSDCLADQPGYQTVLKRLGDTSQADMTLYVEPIGRIEVLRVYNPPVMPRSGKAKDLIGTLRKQGVDGIKGVGATLQLGTERHDLFYRVFVNAPQPLRGGMGVLQMVAGEKFTPEPWVRADAASFLTLNMDIPQAFDRVGGLFDELAPGAKPGTWNDWLKDLKNDPNGPKVDLRKHIVERLDSRILFFTAPPEKYDRLLAAIPVKEAADVKKALRRMFENDEGATSKKVLEHEVWIVEPSTNKKGKTPSRTVFAVANGHFCVSNRFDMMESTLQLWTTGTPLGGTEDYRQVAAELDRLTPAGSRVMSRAFARPALDYRTTYEAARLEKLDDLDSIYARLSLALLGSSEDVLAKLPPFEKVSGFLKPAGSVGLIHPDGWELLGFTLGK